MAARAPAHQGRASPCRNCLRARSPRFGRPRKPKAFPRRRRGVNASPMFVVELTYTAPLEKIDAAMKAHVAFLNKHYAAGTFLISGRKIPREGGIILAMGESREQIEALMREDPFCSGGLAEFRVIEFRASQRAADIPKRIA